MVDLQIKFNEIALKLESRDQVFLFLISLLTLLAVFCHIIKLNILIGIPEIGILEFLFQIIIILSTIYIIIFLPSYPVFFIIFKNSGFSSLEKLNLTIIINLSFYILSAYIGFFMGAPITAMFFFLTLLIIYLSIVSYIILQEFRTNKYRFFRLKEVDKTKFEKFSFPKYVKRILSTNGFLLILFLLLICILNVVRFTYFFGTDPWLHIFIIKLIVRMRYLPLEEYYGSVGLPIFGAVIHFFSGVDIILIPKWFVFYTILVSALVFYNILMKVFNNQSLAIFGVFIIEFAGLGFAYMMYQFWPSHLVIIQSLTIFFLLYDRLLNFLQEERPTKEEVFSKIWLYYIIITLIFITAILTHALTSIIFLISFIWIFFIYFVKDYRRGFDFILLLLLGGIYLTFYVFGLSSEHFFFLDNSSFSFSFLLIFAFIGTSIIGIIIIWKIKNTLLFTKGRFKLVIMGKKYSYYKTIEDKIIIPLALSIVGGLTIFFTIGNVIWFNLPLTIIFAGMELMLFVAFGIWGILIFQKKPRGKLFFIWAIFFLFFFSAVFLFDVLSTNSKYWARVFFIMPPLLVIGFISYVYKLIRTNSITKRRTKYFISFLIIFSLSTSYTHEFFTVQYVSLNKRQVGGAIWYSKHTEDKNVIITEFGFNYMFMYYDYPYSEGDTDLRGRHIHKFIDAREDDLFQPEEQTDEVDGDELKEIKEEEETDVVLTPDDQYYKNDGWDTYGYLDEEDKEEYYEAHYLNRIYSARSEDGEENAYYWVV